MKKAKGGKGKRMGRLERYEVLRSAGRDEQGFRLPAQVVGYTMAHTPTEAVALALAAAGLSEEAGANACAFLCPPGTEQAWAAERKNA